MPVLHPTRYFSIYPVISDSLYPVSAYDKTMPEKVSLAAEILSTYHENDDVVLVIDDGCIIQGNGDLSQWFREILDALDGNIVGIRLAIASKFAYTKMPINKFLNISLPELSPNERRWLLEDYLNLLNVQLIDEEFETCLNWLQGYPQQVFYLAESLYERGFESTKNDSKSIVDYSLRKVEAILSNYLSDSKKASFLATLAELELAKVDDIIRAFDDDLFYKNLLIELLILSVCTTEGVSKEYIRVSEIVRDYLDRKRIGADKKAIKNLENDIKRNFSNDEHGIPDSSDLYFMVKNKMKSGEEIESKYIFPSHFARSMQEMYNRREDDTAVIKIAQLLISKNTTIDSYILHSAYYYFCLANARKKNRELFKYIEKLKPSDNFFIKGFYYRKSGRWLEAIDAFTESLRHNPDNKRAKNELVAALNRVSEFGKAYALAKICYDEDPTNLYYAQEYFKCLLYAYLNKKNELDKETMRDIISSQNLGENTRDQSMLACMKANYEFFVNESEEAAYDILDSNENSDSDVYILFTKFAIAEKSHNLVLMKDTHSKIVAILKEPEAYQDMLNSNEILILAHSGKIDEGIDMVKTLPSRIYSDSYKRKLEERIRLIQVDISRCSNL
jgi:hypothetical protein